MTDFPGLILFTLIAMRMSGFIMLNPIFARRNVPTRVNAGIIMVLSVCVFATTQAQASSLEIMNVIDYVILLLKEFMMGFFVGFIMSLFLFVASYAGGMIDFHMGMSMASVYDPQNNASMPLTGTIFSALMIMLFFAVDGHIAVLKVLLESEKVVPYGSVVFTPAAINSVITIFFDCVILAVKLSFPFLALELLGEVGVGILMKVIPQINVFVVNIQIKVLLGDLLLLLLCIPVGEFLNDVVMQMVGAVRQIITLL